MKWWFCQLILVYYRIYVCMMQLMYNYSEILGFSSLLVRGKRKKLNISLYMIFLCEMKLVTGTGQKL